MFGECHAHLFMNGYNYRHAAELHKNGPAESDLREKLSRYQKAGITFIRDGGDDLGVSLRVKQMASEYGIDYRTPVFAIHKNGHYGKIVGRGFDTMKEYHALVRRAGREGADFIKVMCSGIMDFKEEGRLTEEPLDRETIREMIHIAHEEGFAVMAHVNGAKAIRNAAEGGADSVEHGNFPDADCLQAMKENGTIWVPTFVTIVNLIGSGRFNDTALMRLAQRQGDMIRRGIRLGVNVALGSDAGAYRVPHVSGLQDEYHKLNALMPEEEAFGLRLRFASSEAELQKRFRHCS